MIIPQQQAFKHRPEEGLIGDCFRTAVAMLLGMHRDQVPHFAKDAMELEGDDARSAVPMLRDWLAERGLGLCQFLYTSGTPFEDILATTARMSPGIPFMVLGKSPRGDWGHVVIVVDGKVADPATGTWREEPEKALAGPSTGPDGDTWWWVECIVQLPDPIGNMTEDELFELKADLQREMDQWDAELIQSGMVKD